MMWTVVRRLQDHLQKTKWDVLEQKCNWSWIKVEGWSLSYACTIRLITLRLFWPILRLQCEWGFVGMIIFAPLTETIKITMMWDLVAACTMSSHVCRTSFAGRSASAAAQHFIIIIPFCHSFCFLSKLQLLVIWILQLAAFLLQIYFNLLCSHSSSTASFPFSIKQLKVV